MTPERYSRIHTVLSKRQPDLTVITDEVHKPRNLSAIIRNCDAVGIDEIHNAVPQEGYQYFMGTSASAEKWVESHYYTTVEEPIMRLCEQGFQIVSANLSSSAVDYREVDYTKPTALLLGAEVKGVSAASVSLSHRQVVLPMLGMVESYNVSVACALILAQAQHQREQAGMYDQQRISKERYHQRFIQWGHPTVAKFCDENNIPYPPLREDGEIENLSQWYKQVNTEQV